MYNYYDNVKNDVREYIKEFIDWNGLGDLEGLENNYKLQDELFMADSVTGNASGSYYCNTWKAEEALCHNFDLLQEALSEFCYDDVNIAEKGAEWCDVIIRCCMISRVFAEALEEAKEELNEE